MKMKTEKPKEKNRKEDKLCENFSFNDKTDWLTL